ncbi:hypothetical protein [Lacimicrobium alkaliphilum]|uniref:Uncharacterized protein n=1 Tax=Lacimicrobium alkaliphilum TaxID=1526571 RepID=A0A0U2ZLR3_9ALTE|nr:hypothetical protein [Lacimicrobium alkaliphilum]ALS99260.1 hypothetical protein AT746_14005 [Lacimicrobium alkaliphilum]
MNQFFFPAREAVDEQSRTLYVFKAFPAQLKAREIKQWVELQQHALSPFENGDRYAYQSRHGLHLWFSQSPLQGIPETALQSAMPDGEHFVQGKKFCYRQQWRSGLMQSCVTLTSNNDEHQLESLGLGNNKPWAMQRKLDVVVRDANSWLIFCSFVLLCGLLWSAAGYATLSAQQVRAEQRAEQLTDSLGSKLNQQAAVRAGQQQLAWLQNWQSQYGVLPESFAVIASAISEQGEWKTNQIRWQNRTIEVEFTSAQVDIAALVSAVENTGLLRDVNIRPQTSGDAWILEARFP